MSAAGAPHHAGVLLANLGTPDAPTAGALRRFLREFLSDRRVVDLPRPLWWLVLNLAILPLRPRRSARLYRRIWTAEGSPLLAISRRQQRALERELGRRAGRPIPVSLGMRYGSPGVDAALGELERDGCDRVLLFPLYPQYSCSTTASTIDALAAALARRRDLPELRTVRSYHDHPGYVAALADSVRRSRESAGGARMLLVSFHGIPVRYAHEGDPYPEECARTAGLLAAELGLADDDWQLAFQSRFGREEWLGPATDQVLRSLGSQGATGVDVVCPGFAADCLETLEEIALTGREQFEEAGGTGFHYVPALNDRRVHVAALADIALAHMAGWL